MNEFRTLIPPVQSHIRISHIDRILCIGSCFAENIGGRLERLKFPVQVNPFGIVYNPVSISQTFDWLFSGSMFEQCHLFENLGLWHSYSHHGIFSNPDKKLALENINLSLSQTRVHLEKTSRLIITLGTANVFVLKRTGEVVANCHKVQAAEFDRRRLSLEEVQGTLDAAFRKLKNRLPELEIIATISPVRHLRDGLIENQRSKATLLLALERVQKELDFVVYFPSYEILLDDLRDYRFFAEDMAHPNEQAVDYIWDYFESAYMDSDTKQLISEIKQIIKATEHRPFHQQSAEHQQFIKAQLERIGKLNNNYPELDFSKEKSILGSKLNFT